MNAERALLGCMLRDPSVVDLCPVAPEAFGVQSHADIYSAIRRMVNDGDAVDTLTVAEAMHASHGDKVNWLDVLGQLQSLEIVPSNAETYHRMLLQEHIATRARRQITALEEARTIEQIDAVVWELMQVTNEKDDEYDRRLYEHTPEVIEMLDTVERGKTPGIPTGFAKLDAILGGLYDTDLVVLGARPSHGKTAWLMNVSQQLSVPHGIISGEQPADQMTMRALAIGGGVSLHKMRTGRMDGDDWQRVNRAAGSFRDRPVYIYDKPRPSIIDIRTRARQWHHRHGIRVLLVDYLQDIQGGEGDGEHQRLGDVCSNLKALARTLRIPVVLLSQVKRDVDGRKSGDYGMGRMPGPSDLADSGLIERHADVVITLYRPAVYWQTEDRYEGVAYFHICKNRNGPTGYRKFHWDKETITFTSEAA